MSDQGIPQTATMGGRVPSELPGTVDAQTTFAVPKTSAAGDYLEQAGKSLAAGLDAFGKATQEPITNLLKQKASSDGAQAVARDPQTGALTVQFKPQLDDVSAAFNSAAALTYNYQAQGDINAKAAEIAQANPNDPEAFQTTFNAYLKTYVQNAPAQVRGTLLDMGAQEGSRLTEGIFNNKARETFATANSAINAQISENTNTAMALAHAGGINTPDFMQAFHAVVDAAGQKLANPAFGYSQQQHDADIKAFTGRAQAESVLGNTVQMAQSHGPESAAAFLDRQMADPSLDLSPSEVETYKSRGYREISEVQTQQSRTQAAMAAQLTGHLDDAGALASTGGDWTTVVKPNAIIAAFGQQHGSAIVTNLNNVANGHAIQKAVALASPAEISGMAAQLDPSRMPAAQTGYDAFYREFLAPHEGGYAASDGNGHPVNFGINQGANPDIDVGGLTQDQAKQILHDRYWVPSGADKLPPALAAVQGDTAVNMGVAEANTLLAASGGDAQKYLALREQRYRSIAAADPSKAGSLPAWLQRTQDLGDFISNDPDGGTNGQGLALRLQTYGMLQHAYQDRQKAIAKDSADWVLQNSPEIAQQIQAKDSATFQAGLRALVSAQQHIGVAAPRILNDSAADQILQNFAAPPDQTKIADGLNNSMNSLAQRYGSYFPQAMKELQDRGLPPEASALYMVRGQGGVAFRMANAINSMSNMDGKDINSKRAAYFANAPGNDQISKEIPAAMQDYTASLTGNPQGPQQLSNMSKAVNLYAHELAYEGRTPTDAAQGAVRDLIGRSYNFPGDDTNSYRVPVGVDDVNVQMGANAVRANLKAQNLEPYAEAAPSVSRADRQEYSRQILSGQGRWVTRSDDKGLALVWPQTSGYKPAHDAQGHLISLTWGQLIAASRTEAARRVSPADVMQSGLLAGSGD